MKGLLTVEEAQARILALASPLEPENIPFPEAFGRFLSEDIAAIRDQPAAALSAMDGYAIRFDDLPGPWTIAGEVPAGAAAPRALGAGEAMRIFTGALLPGGADTVVLQEEVTSKGASLKLTGEGPGTRGRHVRERGGDFAAGTRLLRAGMRLTAGAIAAAIMAGAPAAPVRRRPRVAILTTGNELVPPGHPLGPGQIPDSNGAMLAAMLGGEAAAVGLPLHARDDRAVIASVLSELARRHDVIVTVGGASVGEHDHIQGALLDAGGAVDFWKVAMRPGKPLLAGTIGSTALIGLPGNPASAFVTATLFLLPLIRHLAGAYAPLPTLRQAPLAAPLAAGGQRRDYLRARLGPEGLTPFASQDSGQTLPLAAASALLLREAHAPARARGERADYIAIA